MDYSNAYKSYIMASWVCNEKNASDFRIKACQIFAEKVLPYYNSNLLQIGKFANNGKNRVIIEKIYKVTSKIVLVQLAISILLFFILKYECYNSR